MDIVACLVSFGVCHLTDKFWKVWADALVLFVYFFAMLDGSYGNGDFWQITRVCNLGGSVEVWRNGIGPRR